MAGEVDRPSSFVRRDRLMVVFSFLMQRSTRERSQRLRPRAIFSELF